MTGLLQEARYWLLDTPPFVLGIATFALGYLLAVFVHRMTD